MTLIAISLLRLIFNRLFLHFSIWSLHYKFMMQNTPRIWTQKTLSAARKKLDISEKCMRTFWISKSILSHLKNSEYTIDPYRIIERSNQVVCGIISPPLRPNCDLWRL
jgi:hypothetical protein